MSPCVHFVVPCVDRSSPKACGVVVAFVVVVLCIPIVVINMLWRACLLHDLVLGRNCHSVASSCNDSPWFAIMHRIYKYRQCPLIMNKIIARSSKLVRKVSATSIWICLASCPNLVSDILREMS